MEILLKEQDAKGLAMAQQDGKRTGAMTYSIAGEHLIIIDHTEVDPAFKGQQIGQKMLYRIVEMAREKNIKIIPLCPFAAAQFKKLDAIQDVLKS